jgi:hypothetical protein
VVLHVYETRSLIVREDHKLKAFERRLLRGIFDPREMK